METRKEYLKNYQEAKERHQRYQELMDDPMIHIFARMQRLRGIRALDPKIPQDLMDNLWKRWSFEDKETITEDKLSLLYEVIDLLIEVMMEEMISKAGADSNYKR